MRRPALQHRSSELWYRSLWRSYSESKLQAGGTHSRVSLPQVRPELGVFRQGHRGRTGSQARIEKRSGTDKVGNGRPPPWNRKNRQPQPHQPRASSRQGIWVDSNAQGATGRLTRAGDEKVSRREPESSRRFPARGGNRCGCCRLRRSRIPRPWRAPAPRLGRPRGR